MSSAMLLTLVSIPVLLFSIVFHEFGHAWMAHREGDNTAQDEGRLTMNPLPHIDIIGTIILPAIAIYSHFPIIGWAKPVPINPNNFEDFRGGMIRVSLAGPAANFLLAISASAVLYLSARFLPPPESGSYLVFGLLILYMLVQVNIVLGVFNLLPLPPLDGSRFVSMLLPASLAIRYEMLQGVSYIILMVLLFTGVLGMILFPVINFVTRLLMPEQVIYTIMYGLAAGQ